MSNNKLALISPVKDEIDNLPELIESIENLSHVISLWVIIDDDSDDGSSEYLDKAIPSLKNVEKVILIHCNDLSKEYKLGSKYSQVINYGFEQLLNFENVNSIHYDYIGILDSDCFPAPDYYSILINKFNMLPKLGIASGVIHFRMNGNLIFDKLPMRWARGAIRVWRGTCFREAGYRIGNSADAISSALAWTLGWQSQAFVDAKVESREMGIRVDKSYYGKAAYYLYMPFYYILGKCILLVIRSGVDSALTYIKGYRLAKKEGIRIKIENRVKWYFRLILWRNIVESIIIFNNFLMLKSFNPKSKK